MASLEEEVSKLQLFKDIQFSLCEDVIQFENVKKLLLSGGAKFLNYLSDNVTHLIGDNPDHNSVSEAVEIYEKPVVTSRWVWLSAKAGTLLPISGFSPFKNQLFSNIIACPSNISGVDVQSLWAMITYYGGSFRLQMESDCTHLISTKPEGLKYDKAVQTNDKIKIVTPDWVIDSVKNKSLCDEDLYHPRLLIFNNQSSISIKSELSDMSIPSIVTTAGTIVSSGVTTLPNTSGAPQLSLRTVTLPSTAMITTFSIAQPPQMSPTTVQGGRVRVFLPPQHQVRLMQMRQNQIRPQQMGQTSQQVVSVQQMLQRQGVGQQLPQNTPQQQQQQQQQEMILEGQQWTVPQQFVSQNQQITSQGSQPIQVISQSGPDLSKLRPMNTTVMSQQQPRQVYLAVQQTRQQHFIQVQSQQQQRQASNIIIQQRAPTHTNVQSVRLQQAPQHLIQLQQRQPINVQSAQLGQQYVRAPQQIIIQQQNQQAIQRQIQIQQHQNLQVNQQQGSAQPQVGTIPLPQQVQQRMAVQRMPQQFVQQNQMRGQPIRGPMTGQQIISSAMPSGQPRVLMRAPTQYPIQGQQQFEGQQQPTQQQFIRTQGPSGPQLQFIRGPQWSGPQDPNVGQQQQHLTSMRPQHILVTTQATQPQPTQQQILQWQQQDIQRRQLMQSQQNQQRFQVSIGTTQDKVRPTVSVVSVSSSANTDSGAATAAATSTSTVRIAQTPQTISPNISLSNSQTTASAVSVSAQVSPSVNTANTTPNTTVASPIVTPKTKTALANLLNNRLQSGNSAQTKGDGGNTSCDGFPSNVSSTQSLSSSSSSSLPNKTGFIGSPGVALPSGDVVQHMRPEDPFHSQNPVIQIRFYGYDPRIQIPSDQCLMGSVFYITGFEKLVETKLIDLWNKKIIKMGAEVESSYTQRITHVLCENTNSSDVQQALREGKRCVSVYWLNEVLSMKKMFPPSKAFHLPYAIDENKLLKQHIISMTGFEGEERIRVREMVLRTGAKYTNYLTQKNTIIVCKRPEGEKYRKSIEWRLAIVNLIWLQDVLFGQFDGQLLSNIPKKYQNFDLKDSLRIDYSTVSLLMNPWRQPIRLSDEYLKSRIADKNEKQLNIKPENEPKNEDKEETDSKDIKKLVTTEEDTEEPKNKKPKLQITDKLPVIIKEESVSATSNISLPTLQMPNTEEIKKVKVVMTSIKNKQELRSIVLSLGGRVINGNDCTHLVTDRIARTAKFLCCFSSCQYVVTSEWIIESAKQNRFVDENDYILSDSFGEKHFDFNLKHSLSIKSPQLFKDYVFYITHGCIPSPKIIKDIVESAGGRAVTSNRPTRRQLSRMQENGLKFCVISCENDLHLCDIFFVRQIKVLNVELVLSGVLKQELDFDSYSLKQIY